MRRPHVIWLSPVAFALVALLAAGCGGGKSGDEAATTAAETTTTISAETTTTATISGPSEDAYASKELATLSLRQLQKCPSNGATQWDVLYRGKRAIAQCGTGSALLHAGAATVTLKNGWCSMNSTGDVSYYFGSIVTDPSVSGIDQPALAYGPLRFDLSLGIAPHQPVKGDGTYVDAPVSDITKTKYGIIVVIASNGKLWTGDSFDHATTVTLTHERTRGSFSATTMTGESLSGTFRCGDKVIGDAAP